MYHSSSLDAYRLDMQRLASRRGHGPVSRASTVRLMLFIVWYKGSSAKFAYKKTVRMIYSLSDLLCDGAS